MNRTRTDINKLYFAREKELAAEAYERKHKALENLVMNWEKLWD